MSSVIPNTTSPDTLIDPAAAALSTMRSGDSCTGFSGALHQLPEHLCGGGLDGGNCNQPAGAVWLRLLSFAVFRVLPALLSISVVVVFAGMLAVPDAEVLALVLLVAAAFTSAAYQVIRALLLRHLRWRREGSALAFLPCVLVASSVWFVADEQLAWLMVGISVLMGQSFFKLHLEQKSPNMRLRHRVLTMLLHIVAMFSIGLMFLVVEASLPILMGAMLSCWLIEPLIDLLSKPTLLATDDVLNLRSTASG